MTNNPTLPEFIVIDDNGINNSICRMVIEKSFEGAVVNTFTEPEAGIEYITECHNSNKTNKTILLLDINMPSLNGWEVLDQFQLFPEEMRALYQVFMLSSSVTMQDKVHAENHHLVTGYIEKPLTIARLKTIMENMG